MSIENGGTKSVDKKYIDMLSLWDSRPTSLAPLTEKQKESIVELNASNERQIPQKVKFFC